MYLHLGQSVVVPFREVLGVFDLDNASASRRTRAFLERAEKEGRVVSLPGDLPRSFVLCRPVRGGAALIYLSPLSPAALLRRVEGNSFE